MEKSHNSHTIGASHEDLMGLPMGAGRLMLALCLLLTCLTWLFTFLTLVATGGGLNCSAPPYFSVTNDKNF